MKINKDIILASSSPRRKELLEKYHYQFSIDVIETPEIRNPRLAFDKQLEDIAYQKAYPIFQRHPQSLIIGADTMVVCQGEVMGKPKDRDDAKTMLEKLSQNKQTVYTSVCIIDDQNVITFTDQTDVYFKPLTSKDIEDYLDIEEYIGKAGAYAIQGQASQFVDHIVGDIETVIGLPVKRINEYLTSKTDS